MKRIIFLFLLVFVGFVGLSQPKTFYAKGNKILYLSPVYSGSSTAHTIGANLGMGYMVFDKAEVSAGILLAGGYQKIIGLQTGVRYYLFNSRFNIYPEIKTGFWSVLSPTKYTNYFASVGGGIGIFSIFDRVGLGISLGYDFVNKTVVPDLNLRVRIGK